MDSVTMSSLLLSEEERIRTELRADSAIDQNRKQSVDRLNAAFDHMLLRYNAACVDDQGRQALADCQAAPVREMLGLLLAGTARKEITKRRLRVGAIICLLLGVICLLLAALLVRQYFPAGCILASAAALFAFLSGRLWYGEREVRVHAELDADLVLKTLKKTAETMDRKAEEFLAQAESRIHDDTNKSAGGVAVMGAETLKLIGDLLEALYAENGEYALRQLKKLQPWLTRQGIEAVDYGPETSDYFELLPTKRSTATQRPALLSGEKLLLSGRATVHME